MDLKDLGKVLMILLFLPEQAPLQSWISQATSLVVEVGREETAHLLIGAAPTSGKTS